MREMYFTVYEAGGDCDSTASVMRIPLIDLLAQYRVIRETLD